jgi:hypothetical protein
MSIKTTFLFILVSATTLMARGQFFSRYKPGAIITHEDDTLTGLIKDRGIINNAKACYFKSDKKAAPEIFKPGDIKAYWINKERYYYSGEIFTNNVYKQRFLEALVKGKVSLYHSWNNKDRNYFIQRGDNELIELTNKKINISTIPDEALTIYYEQHALENPVYMDTLLSFFRDSRTIQNHIVNIKYNKKALTNITKGYIRETCGSNCIQYQRDFRLEMPQFGFYSGIMFNQLTFLTTREHKRYFPQELAVVSDVVISFPMGIFLDLPLPLIKQNLSLQAEINGTQTEYYHQFNQVAFFNHINFRNTQLGLAFSLRYEFLQKKRLSPSLAFGKNTSFIVSSDIKTDGAVRERQPGDETYTSNDFTYIATQTGGWFGEAGVDFKLNRKYSLFCNFRLYTLNSLIVESFNKGVSYDTILQDFAYPLEYRTFTGALLVGLKL